MELLYLIFYVYLTQTVLNLALKSGASQIGIAPCLPLFLLKV